MTQVIIKTADKSFTNWGSLLSLLQTAFAFQKERIDPPSSLDRMDALSLAQKALEEVLFLAYIDQQLVGCLFAKPREDDFYIGKFAVSPVHQGKGIGRQLYQVAEAFVREQGVLRLEMEVRIELIENQQTFARFGFVKTAERSHAGYDRPTSVVMEKTLP